MIQAIKFFFELFDHIHLFRGTFQRFRQFIQPDFGKTAALFGIFNHLRHGGPIKHRGTSPEQFAQLQPYKNDKGKRFYTEQDIELVKQIKFIRDDLHITRIEAIQTELKQGTKKTDSRQRAAEILLKVRKQLEEIRSLI